jgi:hypothetical protein
MLRDSWGKTGGDMTMSVMLDSSLRACEGVLGPDTKPGMLRVFHIGFEE